MANSQQWSCCNGWTHYILGNLNYIPAIPVNIESLEEKRRMFFFIKRQIQDYVPLCMSNLMIKQKLQVFSLSTCHSPCLLTHV